MLCRFTSNPKLPTFTFYRQYHVSKVYFYSVSDIISEENDRRSGGGNSRTRPASAATAAATAADRTGYCSRGEADHVSVLDCETFHKEQQVRVARNLFPDQFTQPSVNIP